MNANISTTRHIHRRRLLLVTALALSALLTMAACNGDDITALPEANIQPRCAGATGAPVTLDYVSRSWWDETGAHQSAADDFLLAGWASGSGIPVARGFVEFNLAGVTGCIVGAALEVTPEAIFTSDPSESYTLWQVTTSATVLNTDTTATPDPTVFADLGNGPQYGQFTVDVVGDLNIPIPIPLSGAALDGIETGLGGSFVIGLRSETMTQTPGVDDWVRFGALGTGTPTRLLLLVAP